MVTDKITITSGGDNMEAALSQANKMAVYKELSPKNTLYLRLLAEELMGLMKSITKETTGLFWIEDSEDVYRLHLQVDALVDAEMRKQLLETSSSGKNEASRTLMGRLREFFFRDANEVIAAKNGSVLSKGSTTGAVMPQTDWEWSLALYQQTLASQVEQQEEGAMEAWDELEKSVVRHVADDVKVSIKGWKTEMVLIKKMSKEA